MPGTTELGVHFQDDQSLIGMEMRACELGPSNDIARLDRIRTVEVLSPKGAELPERFDQELATVRYFDLGAFDPEPSVTLAASFLVLVWCLVSDCQTDVSTEGFGEVGVKFPILFAASVTAAKIHPCSSRIWMAVFIDSTGTEP